MKKKNFWHDFRLVAITVVIFVFIISSYALYTLNERNQELRQENEILKHNIQEITKQYNQNSIKLELRK